MYTHKVFFSFNIPDVIQDRADWWVEEIVPDPRISFRLADIACTGITDASVDMVSLSLGKPTSQRSYLCMLVFFSISVGICTLLIYLRMLYMYVFMYGDCPVVLLPVLHELPAEVTQRVMAEAYRILKPGGALAIMEMDPLSPG